MADTTAEQLSVVVDGECEARELDFALRRLASDNDLKMRWQSYHLISDALRNNLPEQFDPRFAERIKAAIAAEHSTYPLSRSVRSSWSQPVTGLAVAASVGLLAVTLWSLQPGELRNTAGTQQLAANPASVYQVPSPAVVETDRALQSRLNTYLVNHNEYASMNSVNGVLPYVRMVGYENRH